MNIDDEDDEPIPQPKPKEPKPDKETPIPKPYKPKIPYPQHLRKEKMEAQYGKFLDMIQAVRINVPLVDVLSRMPNYADLDASINLMSYSLYTKLSLKTLKPTKMSIRLADRSFQYPIGIAENITLKCVNQPSLPILIFQNAEDSKVPLILGRPFFTPPMHVDVIDKILEEDFDALLDEGSEILHSIKGAILEEKLFAEFDEFMAMNADENSESESENEEPPFEKITFNTDYKIKTSLEELPTDLEFKPLPDNLEYVFLEEPSFLPVIISSQLSEENKNKLVFILKRHKQAFAW
ncbi:reverse transcriptase domain-containing protein [Tanacetum coccineum]